MNQHPYNLRSLGHANTQNPGTQPSLAPSTAPALMNCNQAGAAAAAAAAGATAPVSQPQGNMGTSLAVPNTTQTYTLLPSPSAAGQAVQPPVSEQQAAFASANDPMQTEPASEPYPHQIHGLGGPTATAPFLQDFSLVAEAAKRAQMSVVMRDLESVTL